MIDLHDIGFKYPKKSRFALDRISLTVNSSIIYTLLGPNGAGKTTIVRILSGLIIPSKGKVLICGHDIVKDEYHAKRKIGLVLGDERTFYFRLSGKQNLEFFGGLYGIDKRNLKSRVDEALESVGLAEHAKLQYMRYSTGMKKRLSMARALLHNPDVFLLDEPNSGVDPHSAKQIREIILSLKAAGKTVLLTTHDMNEAEKLSDEIGYLKDGQLIKTGSVDEFMRLINHRTFKISIADRADQLSPALKLLMARIQNETYCDSVVFEEGSLRINHNGSFDINRTFEILSNSHLKASKVTTIEPSLEDVFIKLAG